jgi:sodium-dependent dicarboxylate transporter 2/3/5
MTRLEYQPHPPQRLSSGEQVFETWRKRFGIPLAPIAFCTVYFLTGNLTPQGQTLSAILALVAVLWITELLPLPVTALLGAALCVILGVAPARQVLQYFADPIVFLFIGSFMLAKAMMIHRLDRRIALGFLSIPWLSAHPTRILGGLGVITALISMWVSNTATTAMMLPIALGILGAMRPGSGSGGGQFATGMMLMVAYSASIGGIGTLVGSPPNLICKGLVRDMVGREIGFLQWMMLCVPMLAVMGVVLLVLLKRLHPAGAAADSSMAQYILRERTALGPWTRGQINTLVAFAVAALLWVIPGILALPIWGNHWLVAGTAGWFSTFLPESIVAILAAILLFILPVDWRSGQFTLTWDQAVQIDWGTILLFGGGLALGTLMFQTGVAGAMGQALARGTGVSSLWMLTGISILLGIVLSEATSNTSSANMVIPVVIGIAQSAGVSPLPPALGACLGASFGFMLPVSTPPNAIVYGSGLLSITSMMRAGILFDIAGFFIIWGGLRILCPLVGLV